MKADLVERAKAFAVKAHTRINHLRKYTRLPYAVHLENVARLVASVTDDPETIAAAWLHDVVEDTPATLDDVETSFGKPVADLVESLTNVSRMKDGNRNNLAHSQDIASYDWAAIARLASRIEHALLERSR